MTDIIASGATDVGRVRRANEDSLYIGDSVFAVADGMGGHLAGEVASALALKPIQELDGKVFPDAAAAVQALRDAVVLANAEVVAKAQDEPSYRGMGTTLTAAMLEGRRVHVAHVGDSRAYLLRDGRFSQLTDDHTLVQHLIDEGQITQEEAASHPQRSIVTRAIGVSREIDVDAMSLDLQPEDQLLLCSDGLTGVVSDQDICDELVRWDDPDATLKRLIDMANHAGGPDNITALLLRVKPEESTPPHGQPAKASEDGHPPMRVTSRGDDDSDDDWARRLGRLGAAGGGGGAGRGRSGRGLKVTLIGIGVLALVALLAWAGWTMVWQSYYIGLDGDDVVIYQGINAELGPIELSRVAETTDLSANDVMSYYRRSLEEGIPVASLEEGRRIVANAPRRDGGTTVDTPEDDAAGDTAQDQTPTDEP